MKVHLKQQPLSSVSRTTPRTALVSPLPSKKSPTSVRRAPRTLVTSSKKPSQIRNLSRYSLVSRSINTVTFVASTTASSSRSDDDAMSVTSWRRSDKEIEAVPPPPFGLMGVAGDLCVARRRRCPCIAFSLLFDLASQAPSANVIVFMERGTLGTKK